MITISCASSKNDNSNIIETFESIAETLATIPFETVFPTVVPTEPTSPIETEPILFDKNITFTYEYINNGDVMPYGLFTPSTASDGESKPLIVWLHGKGEFGITEAEFNNKSLPKILKESELEGFDAYVICPHVTGYWYAEHWFWNNAVDNVKNLLDWFIEEYNIDASRVVISGHSSGGVGAMWIAHELDGYFNKLVVMSGAWIGDKIYEIDIPTIGYVENSGTHYNFMKYTFEPVFGEESLTVYNASHSDINEIVFSEDLDGNNRCDVIEWMLEEVDTEN